MNDILAFSKRNGISIVTFGGGDPFQYAFFRANLETARSMCFVVHVDTNCCGLTAQDYPLIRQTVDLMGIPLDGSAITHDALRGRKGHHRIVTECLEALVGQRTKVKVNTLVTRQNLDAGASVLDIVGDKCIHIWSIYQFMGLGSAQDNSDLYEVSDREFSQAISQVPIRTLPFRVEVGTRHRRRAGYLFAQTDGLLLTHDPQDETRYRPLGTIYDGNWRDEYTRINRSMMSELSVDRYLVRHGAGLNPASDSCSFVHFLLPQRK